MQSKWLGRIGLSVLVMGATCGSALMGCAEERDPINRVQAGVLDKTFFLGNDLADFRDDPEFRTKTFNIDSGANTDNYSATIGGASAVERVRWEVTEKMLFARRSYQESPGADNRGLRRVEVEPGKWEWPTSANGTIIAAYRIESHFDVRRDYNPTTGEQTNTVVENTSDRPWNQRQFMRVDWSENLAQSTSGDIQWVFGENTSASSIAYSPNNDNDQDRPHFEVEGGYFDVTNKYLVKSESTGIWGLSECVIMGFFNGTTSFDCTPTEVKVRSSFERMPVEIDFEPFQESKAFLDVIGNWGNAGSNYMREYGAAPVTAWDPQYGYNDANTTTFYSLHNIWEKSHQDVRCTSNLDETLADGSKGADGTADQCSNAVTGYAGHEGSQCDLYVGKEYGRDGKCTIPVRDRKVKTIAYWLNAEAPQDLTDQVADDGVTITEKGALEENTVTWNQLLSVGIATRREVECRRTLMDHTVTPEEARTICHVQFFAQEDNGPNSNKEMVAFGGWGIDKVLPQEVDQGAPAFTTCHNPVRAYDLPLCGKVGDVARLGDIRKNFAIYWPYASRAPYGGVATIGADPLTGEMVGSTATIMMRSVTGAAAQGRDIIALALGDTDIDTIMNGDQAMAYSKYVSAGRVLGNQDNGLAKAKTQADLNNAIKNLDTENLKVTGAALNAKLSAMGPEQRTLEIAKIKASLSPQTSTMAADNVRLGALLNKVNTSEYGADIANRGLLKILAASQADASPAYEAIAALAKTDPQKLNDLIDQFSFYLGNKGICFQETMATAGMGSINMPQLAPYFKKLYGSGGDAKAKEERGNKIYRDLVREEVKGIAFHEIGHSIGMRHNFASSWDARNYLPQYWQLRTNEGKSTQLCTEPRTDGNDTCMGPRYLDPESEDEQGMGTESRPGIEYFANTSTMEYQIERFGETAGAGLYDLHMMKTLYGRSLEVFDTKITKDGSRFAINALSQGIPDDLAFTGAGYGAHYTKVANLLKLFDPTRDCRDATKEEKAAAKWRVVHGKICSPQVKNHMAYEDMQTSGISIGVSSPTPTGVNGIRWVGKDEKGEQVVRWIYRYGEDYSSGGYMHAKMFDSGADVYEITKNAIRRFNVVYPWQYFRRGNKEFAWWSIAGSVSNATFARLRGYHWNTAMDISRARVGETDSDDAARPAVMATNEMFNFYQNVILMPEPGAYGEGASMPLRQSPRPGALKVWDALDEYDSEGIPTIGTIPLIDARFVQVDFDNLKGGSWDYQNFPKHWGFDEEKVRALKEIVDSRPTLSTVSRENALDGRDPYISFRTDLPHALDRLLGSLLSEDWETIGPSMLADGTLVPFSVLEKDASKLTRPANSNLIFPNMGYQNEIGSGIYALIFSRFATDMTLANKMRVRMEGDAGPVIPSDRKIAFSDPNSGFRYFATRFGTENIGGRAVELGIASRMLQHANDLLAVAYEVEVDALTQKQIWNQYGEPSLKLNAQNQPILKNASSLAQLRRYVGLLDGMRQVGNIFGGGTLGGGGGGDGDE